MLILAKSMAAVVVLMFTARPTECCVKSEELKNGGCFAGCGL